MATLRPAAIMAAGALATAVVAVMAGASPAPVFGGMAGPLVVVVATWIALVRVYRRDPAGVMALMIRAFLIKVLFLTVYLGLMIKVAEIPARPFGISFVAFFIGLYIAEAFYLSRLSARDARSR
jgi:hypothetical protein